MVVEASIPGLFRTVIIIIGVFFLVRFFGRLMNAKRNMADQAADDQERENIRKAKEHNRQNLGRTNVLGKNKGHNDVEDVDFEEIDE